MKSIKIVGTAGSGKSRLITELKKIDSNLKSVNYGDFLEEASGLPRNELNLCASEHYKLADKKFKEFLDKHRNSNCLILVDEHLEIESRQDLIRLYNEESTIGIIFLNPPVREVLNRQIKDKERFRCFQNLEKIRAAQQAINDKAMVIAEQLNIPLLIIKTTKLTQSVNCAIYFIKKLMGR